MESEDGSSLWEELLPGLPSDITLTHIATKLRWTDFHVLSSVSPAWQRAIQSREVHRERIRCNSAETLVVITHLKLDIDGDVEASSISLYSMREKIFYQLPPIPQLGRRICYHFHFIMDGKVYVLGRWCCYHNTGPYCRGKGDDLVYELDLAEQGQWKACTIPKRGLEEEYEFSVGGSLYDRSWPERVDIAVLQGGLLAYESGDGWNDGRPVDNAWLLRGVWYEIHILDDIQTGDEKHEIYFYDNETHSSKLQHLVSCTKIFDELNAIHQPFNWPVTVSLFFVRPLNNEVVALARWHVSWKRGSPCSLLHLPDDSPQCRSGLCVLQTKGFGSESTEIEWECVTHYPLDFRYDNKIMTLFQAIEF